MFVHLFEKLGAVGNREEMQRALLSMIGQPQQQKPVAVDMAAALAEKGLAQFFDAKVHDVTLRFPGACWLVCQLWPSMAAVRELATKLKARRNLGELKVIVFADMRK